MVAAEQAQTDASRNIGSKVIWLVGRPQGIPCGRPGGRSLGAGARLLKRHGGRWRTRTSDLMRVKHAL